MRVFVVDAHPLFREGLRWALAATADLTVAGEGGSLLDITPNVLAGCQILAIGDEIESLSFLGKVRDSDAPMPFVLVFADRPVVERAIQFLTHGANGYVSKRESADKIIGALRTVGSGRRFVADEVAEALVLKLSRKEKHSGLSNREYEVLHLLASGLTVSEIATKLDVSVKTISTYRTRLMEKLNVSNNAALIRYALQERMIS
jgi:two-component system invasion response regulator UvrY